MAKYAITFFDEPITSEKLHQIGEYVDLDLVNPSHWVSRIIEIYDGHIVIYIENGKYTGFDTLSVNTVHRYECVLTYKEFMAI